jgi:hypothetical protein
MQQNAFVHRLNNGYMIREGITEKPRTSDPFLVRGSIRVNGAHQPRRVAQRIGVGCMRWLARPTEYQHGYTTLCD